MEKYLKSDSDENRIVFPKDFSNLKEFTITCDWGVYNRIFIFRSLQWEKMRDTTLEIYTNYYEAKTCIGSYELHKKSNSDMELWRELIVAFAIKDKFDYIAAWFL